MFGLRERERDTILAVLKGSHSDNILDRAWPSIALQGGMQEREGEEEKKKTDERREDAPDEDNKKSMVTTRNQYSMQLVHVLVARVRARVCVRLCVVVTVSIATLLSARQPKWLTTRSPRFSSNRILPLSKIIIIEKKRQTGRHFFPRKISASLRNSNQVGCFFKSN